MALPQPALDDAALVAAILRDVPGADDGASVRALLEAWWRYAGLRAATGAIVDSERFVAERASVGMLELPRDVALRVIEREFALLHGAPARRAAPADAGGGASTAAPHLRAVPAAAADPWPETPALAAPIQLGAGPRRAQRSAADAERLVMQVLAGGVLFFAVVVGLAVAAALGVRHVPLPLGAHHALVPPWRAWLAIMTGLGGLGAAEVALRLRRVPPAALAGPRVGLAGLAVAGLGMLAGSVPVLVAGLVALAAGAARGTRKRA